jgi:hydroxyacylglutathione hydrolase
MRKPITKNEIEELQQNIPVKFIDIRSVQEYEKQHAPVAINIPAEELNNHLSSFKKEDTIICICNHGKERSQQAAEMLYTSGFENTFYLTGGTAAWFAE